MKKLIVGAIILVVLFFTAINSSMLADQALSWVKDNPKDDMAPEILYRAGRWCDILGDNMKAEEVYNDLYKQYPEKGEWVAPAMYYCAEIISDTSSARRMADPYLEIVINQYPNEGDWATKAKQLLDEVDNVH